MAEKLSKEAKQMRDRVVLTSDSVLHAQSSNFPGNYPGIDDTWDLERFKENFRIDIISLADRKIEFDMIGVDASIANTFRRILIAEVPTMAIESCFFTNNTSLIPDELLAHRLGLIPLKVDPRSFLFKDRFADSTPENTLVFELNISCKKNQNAAADATLPDEKYINHSVLSKHIVWKPQGNQAELFPEGVSCVHDDILINKLKPGQDIAVEMYAVKGIGKEHAKWSPVATASYRLLPEIILHKPISGQMAIKLQSCFSKGVIGIDATGFAFVANARLDTMSREILRHEEFNDIVTLQRVRDHFIFSVESTGALPAFILVREAIKILKEKLSIVKTQLINNTNE